MTTCHIPPSLLSSYSTTPPPLPSSADFRVPAGRYPAYRRRVTRRKVSRPAGAGRRGTSGRRSASPGQSARLTVPPRWQGTGHGHGSPTNRPGKSGCSCIRLTSTASGMPSLHTLAAFSPLPFSTRASRLSAAFQAELLPFPSHEWATCPRSAGAVSPRKPTLKEDRLYPVI